MCCRNLDLEPMTLKLNRDLDRPIMKMYLLKMKLLGQVIQNIYPELNSFKNNSQSHRSPTSNHSRVHHGVCSYQVGNATRVPGHPTTRVNPPIFKQVNPGLCAGKNPGLRVWRKYLITIKIIKLLMIVYSHSLNAWQPESVNPLNPMLIDSIIYLVVFPTAVLLTSLWCQSERAFSVSGTCVQRFVRASVTLRWILCAFCAVIIASGLGLQPLLNM